MMADTGLTSHAHGYSLAQPHCRRCQPFCCRSLAGVAAARPGMFSAITVALDFCTRQVEVCNTSLSSPMPETLCSPSGSRQCIHLCLFCTSPYILSWSRRSFPAPPCTFFCTPQHHVGSVKTPTGCQTTCPQRKLRQP